MRALLEKHAQAFQHLANASPVTLAAPGAPRPGQTAVHVEPEVEVHLPLAGLIDFDAEKVRVEKELGRIAGELQGIEKRLGNAGFVERAPREVVEKDRARSEELQGKREKLARHLARITSVEAGMEEKNPQQGQGGNATPSAAPAPEHNRSINQMGTHGGPGNQPPTEGGKGGVAAEQKQAAEELNDGEESEGREAAEDGEGLMSKGISKVKSIARGLMNRKPDAEAEDEETSDSDADEDDEEPAEVVKLAPVKAKAAPKAPASKPAAKPAPAATKPAAAKPSPKPAAAKPSPKLAAAKPSPKPAAKKAAPAKKASKPAAKKAAARPAAKKAAARPAAKKAAASKGRAAGKGKAGRGSSPAAKKGARGAAGKSKQPAKKAAQPKRGAVKGAASLGSAVIN